MDSPKSRAHKEKKTSYRRREHKNKAFYNSRAWRETREAYLKHYRAMLFRDIPYKEDRYIGKWMGISLTMAQSTYLLSIINKDFLPCEICLRLYIADAYDGVEKGVELDHIEKVNPENALNRVFIGAEAIKTLKNDGINPAIIEGKLNYMYGDPFSFDNLQLLCKRHHAKKSQRER